MNFLSAIKAEAGIQLLNASGGAFSSFSNGATAARTWTLPDFDHNIGRTTAHKVAQTAHGFSVGNAIYFNGTTFAKAKADALSTCSIGFIVSAVIDANTFVFTSNGYVSGLSGLTTGSTYYVSQTTAGALTTTEPDGYYYSNPVLFALSTTEAIVYYNRACRSKKLTFYTPTITAGSGSFGTLSATGYFNNVDDYRTWVSIVVDVTASSTAGGYLYATLPFTVASAPRCSGAGKEIYNTGKTLNLHVPSSDLSKIWALRYDSTSANSGNPTLLYDFMIYRG